MKNNVLLSGRFVWILSVLMLGLFAATVLQAQTVVNHDIASGHLLIPGTSTSNYVITGGSPGLPSSNQVIVGAGYQGTITLKNLFITNKTARTHAILNGAGANVTTGSCIAVMGENNRSNLNPKTRVKIVIDGQVQLLQTTEQYYCAIQVDQGAQIHISAIDPDNNASGVLVAKSTSYEPGHWGTGNNGGNNEGGAAIGSLSGGYTSVINDYIQGSSPLSGSCGSMTSGNTSGGNIIISSGTITAWGGHGAGIGGGYRTYYNGIIVVYGGIIDAHGGFDAAGIGSGCPTGSGVISCYADNSAIIALPPVQITAYGAGANSGGGVGSLQYATLGLAGTKNITYINDPNKPLITVRTADNEPNADIYLDLTETPGLTEIFSTLSIDYDLTKVKVGRTNAAGTMSFNGRFEENTTFFTDASSSHPDHLGRPYLPVTRTVTASTEVVLPWLTTNISFTDYTCSPLVRGYSSTQARNNAHVMKLKYDDAQPMVSVDFHLQSGTDFSMTFLAADSSTVVSKPTTLSAGDVYFIVLPINTGKIEGVYSDVLLVSGSWNGSAIPGYIRRIGRQRVVYNDTDNNTYVKVTASPNKFTESHPTTRSVTLSLNITHTGLGGEGHPYNAADVTAKYLVTSDPNYESARAANPISTWSDLNIPATDNGTATTTVSFAGKPQGLYYIHWYVVSGVIWAHSKTVDSDPPRTYGGFGAYSLFGAVTVKSITATRAVYIGETVTLASDLTEGGGGTHATTPHTYEWQHSTSETGPWTRVTGSTHLHHTHTSHALHNHTYFRRATTDAVLGVSYSNVLLVLAVPQVAYWKQSARNNNWNDSTNWVDASGSALNSAPTGISNVHIPGNATIYPDLSATPTTGLYGPPACNEIHFHFGGEVAKPHLLTYNKAFVQYNFGYYDAGHNILNGDPYSTAPMNRAQWYALAAPLKKIVTGDFSVGGYPNTWQMTFTRSNVGGSFAGIWAAPDKIVARELDAGQGYATSVWVSEYDPGYLGEGDHTNLNTLKGVFEMPYFEDAAVSATHRIHSYDGSTSTFQYYYTDYPNLDLIRLDSIKDEVTRGSEAYRFIFDGLLQNYTIDGSTQPTFILELPAGKEVMIGNPFMSNFDFNEFYRLNSNSIGRYYRLFVGNTFITYDALAAAQTLTKNIAPQQAFIITTTGSSGTVQLRIPPGLLSVSVPNNKLKAPEGESEGEDVEDVLYVNAESSGGNGYLTLSFATSVSENVPSLFATKYPKVPQLYATEGTSKNAVQFTGGYNVTVPVGIWCQEPSEVELKFYNLDRVHPTSLVLVDKLLGKSTDLLKTDSYKFTNEGRETAHDRFELRVGAKAPTAVDNLGSCSVAKVSIYASGKMLYARSNENIAQITVINAQGQQVLTVSDAASSVYEKELPVAPGVYIVRVKTESGYTETGKVVVN